MHFVFLQIVKGKDSSDNLKELNVIANGDSSIPAITSFRFVNRTSFVLSTRIPVNYFDFQADSASINVEGSLTMDLKGSVESRKLQVAGVESKNRQLQSGNVIDDQASFGVSISLEPTELTGGNKVPVVMSAATAADMCTCLALVAILAMGMVW